MLRQSEYENSRLSKYLRMSIDLLTGVPSIVIGIFAYLLFVVPMGGFSAIAGGFALSIIILPIVTRSTEEILKLIPFQEAIQYKKIHTDKLPKTATEIPVEFMVDMLWENKKDQAHNKTKK